MYVFLPASILFAIAISPSLDRSSTDPISLRYILTGSSVLSKLSVVDDAATNSLEPSDSDDSFSCLSSCSSSLSISVIPISERAVIISSICSELISPGGIVSFNSE